MERAPTDHEPKTFTDLIRNWASSYLTMIGSSLHQMGIHPDAVTLLGWIFVLIGSVFIAQGQFLAGAIWLMIALPCDAIDGAIARAMQRTGRFGAMLDSTLDRYADGFIFASLSYYFAMQDMPTMLILAQLALIGSLLVSYTRARAEGLGVECKVGWFTRLERLVVIMLMLFFPITLHAGVWLLAIGTNITAVQRIWYVYQTLSNRGE